MCIYLKMWILCDLLGPTCHGEASFCLRPGRRQLSALLESLGSVARIGRFQTIRGSNTVRWSIVDDIADMEDVI